MFRSLAIRSLLALVSALALACSEAPADADSGTAANPAPEVGSGSGYTITHLREGTGPQPMATDTVLVHYHGTFPDGRVFDSSVQRGEPARFPLNRVIPCWTQGVAEMRVGGKALLVCSPDVAYGARGAPPRIPPDATLHFEVELLEIQ